MRFYINHKDRRSLKLNTINANRLSIIISVNYCISSFSYLADTAVEKVYLSDALVYFLFIVFGEKWDLYLLKNSCGYAKRLKLGYDIK